VTAEPTSSRWSMLTRFQATDDGHRVTTLELFFDLVFVFAFTQVTQLMAGTPTAVGGLRGLVLLSLLWWAWCSYAWLGNQAHAEEGIVRVTMLMAMAAMFVVALAIPESFSDLPGGLFDPAVLAIAYVLVRALHLGCYFVAAGEDRGLRRQLGLTAIPVAAAGCLLVAGGIVGPPYQTLLWALALVVDYAGIWLAGSSGWRLNSPAHFAERYGLIVIVAIGESVVALGVGVNENPISVPVLVGATLGFVVSGCLWWLYFDVSAHVAEECLEQAQGEERSRLARDAYTYLHFPIVVSVIFLALGLKKTLQYVADSDHHHLTDALTGLPLIGLYAGPALYLLAHVGFRARNTGAWNRPRTVAAAILMALLPLGWRIPALASLGVVAAVLVGLIAYELVVFGEHREEIRERRA
jgi:low temperature requirement protein LtrA